MLFAVYPLTPTTCRYQSIVFTLRGRRSNPLAWAISKFLRSVILSVGKKIFAEDAVIYSSVQQGLMASPHRGVIGNLEERINVFQEFVIRSCRGAQELPLVDAVTHGEGD